MTDTSHLVRLSQEFQQKHFPDALGAIASGSLFRGQGTASSDIDFPVIDPNIEYAYRETFSYKDQIFECFIHNKNAIRHFFEKEFADRKPVLPHMYATGIIICDENDLMSDLQKEAQTRLSQGPSVLSRSELDSRLYGLTTSLDDLIDCRDKMECNMIFSDVLQNYLELRLLNHKKWIGSGKWLIRHFKDAFPQDYKLISSHIEKFYKQDSKVEFCSYIQLFLESLGGRLEAGYRSTADKVEN